MLIDAEEIMLTCPVADAHGAQVTHVLGRSLLQGLNAARERGLRVRVSDDYQEYLGLARARSARESLNSKPCLDRPDFAGFLVYHGERIVGTSAYYMLPEGVLADHLEAGLETPTERWTAADALTEIPLAARYIAGRIAVTRT